MGRTSLLTALSTDSHRRRYVEPLLVLTDLAIIGRVGTRSRVRIAVAVPFASTDATWLGPGISYPLRFLFVAVDPAGRSLVRVDSTIRPTAVVIEGERYLAGVITIPLPPGRARVRMVFEDNRRGTVLGVRSVEVADGTEDRVQMSDLAVGAVGGPWGVSLGAERVQLNPLGVLRQGQDAEVAFQVSIPRATEIGCQITVIRADERPGVAYSRQWTERAQPGTRTARHALDLDGLKPGLYRVEVTVTTQGGGLERRWREFTVTR